MRYESSPNPPARAHSAALEFSRATFDAPPSPNSEIGASLTMRTLSHPCSMTPIAICPSSTDLVLEPLATSALLLCDFLEKNVLRKSPIHESYGPRRVFSMMKQSRQMSHDFERNRDGVEPGCRSGRLPTSSQLQYLRAGSSRGRTILDPSSKDR